MAADDRPLGQNRMRKSVIPVAFIVLVAAIVLLGAGLLRWQREVLTPVLGALKVVHVFDRWTGQRWQTVYTLKGSWTLLQVPSEVLQARSAKILARDEYQRDVEAASWRKQEAAAEQERYRDEVKSCQQVAEEVRDRMRRLPSRSFDPEYEYIGPWVLWHRPGWEPSESRFPRAVLAALPREVTQAVIAYWKAVNAEAEADNDLEAIQTRAESQARQELTAEASLLGRLLTGVWVVLLLGCLAAGIGTASRMMGG